MSLVIEWFFVVCVLWVKCRLIALTGMAHCLTPEVVVEQLEKGRLAQHVRVAGDRWNVVVHELSIETIAEAKYGHEQQQQMYGNRLAVQQSDYCSEYVRFETRNGRQS